MASSADDNTAYSLSSYSLFLSLSLSLSLFSLSLSAELDATLKRLKTTQLIYLNGFKKTVSNLRLINANLITISKSEEEIQLGETSLTSINRVKLLGYILTDD